MDLILYLKIFYSSHNRHLTLILAINHTPGNFSAEQFSSTLSMYMLKADRTVENTM